MATTPPLPPPDSSGIRIGDVGGSVNFSALGDIVGGDKITTITTTIQISVEAITQRPLITTSPYRGLDRFEDRDKDLFFGRDQLIKSLLAQLSASNVLLVLGASGSGKSSVVRAGLLPQLSQLIGARFRYFTFVPDVNPFESLRTAVQGAGFSQAQTRELVDAKPETPANLIHTLQREGEQWLFFVDQFEEIFTVGDEKLRASFIAALLQIARDSKSSAKLVLAMRADFLDRFSPFPEFAKILERNIHLVADMHADELRQAIEQPAARHGVVFEQGLVEEIIKDVQGQAGSLPLLQYTLDLLWEEEAREDGLADRHLNTKAYRELGGVRGALQKRADEIYASFGDGADGKTASPKQEIVRQIFLRLVELAGEGANDAAWRPVRRRASIAIFTGAQEQEILQALVNKKLLVSNREGDDATVEVAHEALFISWGRLKNWIEAGKQVIFAKNRLDDDARRWQRRLKASDPGAGEELISGIRLSQALDMRARGDFVTIVGGLGEEETKFLDASLLQRDRRAQSELEAAQRLAEARKLATSRLQVGLAVALVLLLGAFGALLYARATAQKSRQTFSEADFIQASELIEQGHVNEALAHLARALRTWPENSAAADRIFALLTQRSFLLPASEPVNIGRGVTSIRFAEGKWLAASRDMGYASVMDPGQTTLAARGIIARAIASTKSHELPALTAELSSDGKMLATACGVPDLSASDIWPHSRQETPTDRQWAVEHQSVVSSRDSQKGYAQVWDAGTGEPITPRLEHGKSVLDVDFSPDNKRVVTASEDRTARVWDAKTGAALTPPLQHDATVISAEFSPDGTRVQTVSDRVTIWDSITGTKLAESAFPAIAAISSPDGRFIAAASAGSKEENASMQLLDAVTGKEIGQPIDSGPAITSIQFDPDGKRVRHSFAGQHRNKDDSGGIIEASTADGKADKARETGGISVNAGFLAPDGSTLLVALGDRTLRLWDNQQFSEIKALAPSVTFPGPPIHLAFDKTGTEYAVLYKDPEWETGTDFIWFQRWNRQTSAARNELHPMEKGPVPVPQTNNVGDLIADKSRDGKRELVLTQSGTVYLSFLKAENPARSLPQEGEYGGAFGMQTAKFSPDGRLIATGEGGDFRIATGFARIWDGLTGTPRTKPMRHSLAVTFAAFTPDNERLVTVDSRVPKSTEGVHIRIWDVRTGLPITDPLPSEVGTEGVQFSSDRARLTGFSSEQGAEMVDIGLPLGSQIPDWFPRLAEIIGGLRLNPNTAVMESLGQRFQELEKIRALLAAAKDSPITALGKWFLADPGTRTISPYSRVTVPDYVAACLQSGDEKSLDRAQAIAAGSKELLAKIAAARAKDQSPP